MVLNRAKDAFSFGYKKSLALWKSTARGRDRRLNIICMFFFYIFVGFLAFNLWNITYKFSPYIV